jgi:acyl carrier protein
MDRPMRQVVAGAAVEVCGLDPADLTDGATLVDLGVDSLDVIEIGMIVERSSGVQIDLDDFVEVRTFGEAVELFERLTTR